MGRITLKEYAKLHGRAHASVRQMALRGSFQTARKEGRDWFIDEEEEYPDNRVKGGEYIGRSQKYYKSKKTV